MQTLVVYDESGYLLSVSASMPVPPREPIGVLFLWVDTPQGKQIKVTDGIVVDTSVTPHAVEFVDIPKTEIELLREELQNTHQAIDFLIMGGL